MIRSTEEFRLIFKAARRSGTPLVALRTADPASAMAQVTACVNGTSEQTPLLSWDFISGLQGRNEAGKSAAAKVLGENVPSLGPGEALAAAQRLAQDAILFFHNPQRVWEQVDVVQGIWNLRDMFKAGGQMLVLVTPAGVTLPVELQNDVMLIDEPLPSGSTVSACLTLRKSGRRNWSSAVITGLPVSGFTTFPQQGPLRAT